MFCNSSGWVIIVCAWLPEQWGAHFHCGFFHCIFEDNCFIVFVGFSFTLYFICLLTTITFSWFCLAPVYLQTIYSLKKDKSFFPPCYHIEYTLASRLLTTLAIPFWLHGNLRMSPLKMSYLEINLFLKNVVWTAQNRVELFSSKNWKSMHMLE